MRLVRKLSRAGVTFVSREGFHHGKVAYVSAFSNIKNCSNGAETRSKICTEGQCLLDKIG